MTGLIKLDPDEKLVVISPRLPGGRRIIIGQLGGKKPVFYRIERQELFYAYELNTISEADD